MKVEVFIGVDVCKPRLDVTILPTGEMLEFDNTIPGIKQFVKRVKKLKPTLIACEYTGGLEQPLLIACAEAGLPIAVVNPKQVRSCSQDSTWRAVRADFAGVFIFLCKCQPVKKFLLHIQTIRELNTQP